MTEFAFEFHHVKVLLAAMRELRLDCPADELKDVNETYCLLRTQMLTDMRELPAFMRSPTWIHAEMLYEETAAVKNCLCSGKGCGKPCRGWKCADCWRKKKSLFHGQAGHVCKVEQIGVANGSEEKVK